MPQSYKTTLRYLICFLVPFQLVDAASTKKFLSGSGIEAKYYTFLLPPRFERLAQDR